MSSELQNEEFYLKGDLGTVNGSPINKVVRDNKSRTVTLTISQIQSYVNEALEEFGDLPKTEDIEHEEIPNKLNQLKQG